MNRKTNKLIWTTAGLAAVMLSNMLYREMKKFRLRGKVVLITGGSRGLGLVLARQLAAKGAHLALCARSADQLENARQELAQMGAEVMTLTTDVTDNKEVEAMIANVINRYGRLDVLVNNAGIVQVGPEETMEIEDYEKAMKTHFWAPLYAMRAALPYFLSQKEGRIVNITSIGGVIAVPHLLPYSASKFALIGLSEGLEAAYKKHNVHVTTVIPNLMRTGSPRNITVKGNYEAEYAWFKMVGSSPLITQKAEIAARSIIRAMQYGEAEAILSTTGRLLTILKGLAPGWVTTALELANKLLPENGSISGRKGKKGYEAESEMSQSPLTNPADEAAKRNNEL